MTLGGNMILGGGVINPGTGTIVFSGATAVQGSPFTLNNVQI